jgi:hypothetical protein
VGLDLTRKLERQQPLWWEVSNGQAAFHAPNWNATKPTHGPKKLFQLTLMADSILEKQKEEPRSGDSEPAHVFDWLELPPLNDAEKDAKEWLDKYLQPAYTKHKDGTTKWLERYRVTVEWKGKRYTCTGASRLGDVWLKTEGSSNYYDHRVNVEELFNWKRIVLPIV